MKVTVALGGNALLKRDQPPAADNHLGNIRRAAAQLARLAVLHDLMLNHGNGPQVGLLLPVTRAVTTLITRVEVDPQAPAFKYPSKPIGPVYTKAESERMAADQGWVMAADGDAFRRVAASALPLRVLGLRAIRWLLDHGALVIAAGGGRRRWKRPVATVVDKHLCASLLARELQADVLVIATDVPAVFLDRGQSTQRAIGKATPQALAGHDFAASSTGPKVEAARAFALATGQRAVIGSLEKIEDMLVGKAGAQVRTEAAGGADTL